MFPNKPFFKTQAYKMIGFGAWKLTWGNHFVRSRFLFFLGFTGVCWGITPSLVPSPFCKPLTMDVCKVISWVPYKMVALGQGVNVQGDFQPQFNFHHKSLKKERRKAQRIFITTLPLVRFALTRRPYRLPQARNFHRHFPQWLQADPLGRLREDHQEEDVQSPPLSALCAICHHGEMVALQLHHHGCSILPLTC